MLTYLSCVILVHGIEPDYTIFELMLNSFRFWMVLFTNRSKMFETQCYALAIKNDFTIILRSEFNHKKNFNLQHNQSVWIWNRNFFSCSWISIMNYDPSKCLKIKQTKIHVRFAKWRMWDNVITIVTKFVKWCEYSYIFFLLWNISW